MKHDKQQEEFMEFSSEELSGHNSSLTDQGWLQKDEINSAVITRSREDERLEAQLLGALPCKFS